MFYVKENILKHVKSVTVTIQFQNENNIYLKTCLSLNIT